MDLQKIAEEQQLKLTKEREEIKQQIQVAKEAAAAAPPPEAAPAPAPTETPKAPKEAGPGKINDLQVYETHRKNSQLLELLANKIINPVFTPLALTGYSEL